MVVLEIKSKSNRNRRREEREHRKRMEKEIAESSIMRRKTNALPFSCTLSACRRRRSNEAEVGHALRAEVVVLRSGHEGLGLALVDPEEDLSTDLCTQEGCFLGAVSAPRGTAGAGAGTGSVAVRATFEVRVVLGKLRRLDNGGPLEVTSSVLRALVHARGTGNSGHPGVVVRGGDQKGIHAMGSRMVLRAGLALAHLGGRVGSAGGDRCGEGGWNLRGENGGRGRVHELLRDHSEKSLVETWGGWLARVNKEEFELGKLTTDSTAGSHDHEVAPKLVTLVVGAGVDRVLNLGGNIIQNSIAQERAGILTRRCCEETLHANSDLPDVALVALGATSLGIVLHLDELFELERSPLFLSVGLLGIDLLAGRFVLLHVREVLGRVTADDSRDIQNALVSSIALGGTLGGGKVRASWLTRTGVALVSGGRSAGKGSSRWEDLSNITPLELLAHLAGEPLRSEKLEKAISHGITATSGERDTSTDLLGNGADDRGDIGLGLANVDDKPIENPEAPRGSKGGIHICKPRDAEVLEDEAGDLLPVSLGPAGLGHHENGGVERRAEQVVNVLEEGEERVSVHDAAVSNGIDGALVGHHVFLVKDLLGRLSLGLFSALGGSLARSRSSCILHYDILLEGLSRCAGNGGRSGVRGRTLGDLPNPMRFVLASFLSWEHARRDANLCGAVWLRQAELREGQFRTGRDELETVSEEFHSR